MLDRSGVKQWTPDFIQHPDDFWFLRGADGARGKRICLLLGQTSEQFYRSASVDQQFLCGFIYGT